MKIDYVLCNINFSIWFYKCLGTGCQGNHSLNRLKFYIKRSVAALPLMIHRNFSRTCNRCINKIKYCFMFIYKFKLKKKGIKNKQSLSYNNCRLLHLLSVGIYNCFKYTGEYIMEDYNCLRYIGV